AGGHVEDRVNGEGGSGGGCLEIIGGHEAAGPQRNVGNLGDEASVGSCDQVDQGERSDLPGTGRCDVRTDDQMDGPFESVVVPAILAGPPVALGVEYVTRASHGNHR